MSDYIYPPPASLPPGSDVIAYIRDSGGPNQQESIGQQKRVIQTFCNDHGLALVRVYAESASGRSTKDRDQFLEMFNGIMNNHMRPRGLILWAYSRFSRDVVEFNYYLYGLKNKGLIIHSLTEQISDGIEGQLFLSFKAHTNADFSIQLGKQIKRAIADRVKSGYSNGGNPPKGYKIVREYQGLRSNGIQRSGVKWEPDPILAPLVRLAWEMRAQGKSYPEITKATEGKIYTSSNSWVSHFRNESYIGIGKAGELRVEDHHEPLITWELWQAVKHIEAESKKRFQFHHRRNKYPSLLAGLAYCHNCGAAMVVHTSPKYRAYTCGKRDRKNGFSECPNSHRVNAPKVERQILEAVFTRILTPHFVVEILADVQRQFTDTEKIDREIGDVTNALTHAERSITRLVKLVEDTGEIDEIKTRLVELKQEQAQYKNRVRVLKAEKEQQSPNVSAEALALVFETWRSQIQSANERGDILTVKKLLGQFVKKIELGNGKVIIHYTYPLSNPAENDKPLSAHKPHHG